MTEEHPFELVSQITELNDLHEFMNDEQLDRAMHLVIKLITKIEEHTPNVPRLIVELQAISAKCALMAAYYATIGRDKAGTPNNYKKNIYYSAKEALDRLVDSLKYLQKAGS